MTTYSHSKLSTFQQCKYKYKLQYIDRIKTDFESIEAFMGKIVHEVLDKLYADLKFQKLNSKTKLLQLFEKKWNDYWHDKIRIVKKEYSAKHYKSMGKKFIKDYYEHYKPFDQLKTLGLETQDRLQLEDNNQYHIRIDRLATDNEGNYYICDYKTNSSLKLQSALDEDKQLAMYSLWVRKQYQDAKSVKLVWYFLAFDTELVSERNEKQLAKLKKQTEDLIRKVESCKKFSTNITALCDYCSYKEMCPAWKHEFEVKEKKKFKDDEGVILVDEFSELQEAKRQAEKKIGEIKESLIEFSKQKGYDVIFGTDKKCSVKEYEKIVYPEDKEEFLRLIKKKGLYDDLSSLNYFKLGPKILKEEIDEDVIKMTNKETAYRLSLSKLKGN